jgi:hypothetical protein
MASARRTPTTGSALLRWAFSLSLVAIAAAPSAAHAQAQAADKSSGGAARAALVAERQQVRAELEKANAEIDALKRSGRGLRDDYRLRARLADAEALARRLTALDARLGGGAQPAAPASPAEPRALPTDGPAELEAKADILNDQARRLAARGEALLARAHDLRARQNLRRRVGQMERDPFAPLEGSKRRAMAPGSPSTQTRGSGSPTVVGGSNDPGGPGLTGGQATAPPPAAGPKESGFATDSNAGSSAVSAPRIGPTGISSESVALSTQLRDLLDPATLAQLQRLEGAGGAANGYEALERAAAALKARAERLGQQAAELRARAR